MKKADQRRYYATHPTDGPAQDLLATASGGDWVPTVVNPSKTGGSMELALFYLHLGVWVVALILSCVSNFGASGMFGYNSSWIACTNAAGDANAPDNCGGPAGDYPGGITTTTQTIGILGGVFSILGVGALLGGAAYFNAEQFREQVWLNAIIQFFTLYGTSASFFIFCQAASNTSTGIFYVSLFAVMFMLYAQVLLYCTSATLDVLALPRAFIPSLAASIQFISALSISGNEFKQANGNNFTNSQKFLAWMVPVLTIVSVVLMIGLRRWTRNAEGVSELGERPFLRSLVLTPFLLSGTLSVYKMSFIGVQADAVAYMFALFGMMLNFAIISVVFVPSGVSSNAKA